jgi:hypothetical protein
VLTVAAAALWVTKITTPLPLEIPILLLLVLAELQTQIRPVIVILLTYVP